MAEFFTGSTYNYFSDSNKLRGILYAGNNISLLSNDTGYALSTGTVATASYALTASYFSGSIANAISASYVLNAVSASRAVTSSYVLNAVSSSFSTTASYVVTAQTASYVLNAVSSSFSTTASYVLNAVSASRAVTSSYAITSSATTAFDGAWISYTPVWTAASSNPDIKDGSLQGWYKLVGKTCFVRGNIVMGSSTTFGSGEWYVSMPFTASHADAILMTANLLDNGSAWYNALLNGARAGFNYKTAIQYQSTGGTALDVNATQPFTWANTDRFIWNGSYEIA